MSKIPDFLLASPPSPATDKPALAWLLQSQGAPESAMPDFLKSKPVAPPSWIDTNARLDASKNAGLLANHVKPAKASNEPSDDLAKFVAHQSLRKVFKQFKRLLEHDNNVAKRTTAHMVVQAGDIADMVASGHDERSIRDNYASCWGLPGATIVAHYDCYSDSFDFVAHGTGQTTVTLSTKDVKALAWKLASSAPDEDISETRQASLLAGMLSRPRLATRRS